MRQTAVQDFARRLYRRHHGAEISPTYLSWRTIKGADDRLLAVLGYRSAGEGHLFLERYLDEAIEDRVFAAIGTRVPRDRIVEIGCLAALPSSALPRLWELTAVALSKPFDVAVATLTAPLRAQFRRIGLPVVQLEAADQAKAGTTANDWGRYYAARPVVCVGRIADGTAALTAFSARMGKRA